MLRNLNFGYSFESAQWLIGAVDPKFKIAASGIY